MEAKWLFGDSRRQNAFEAERGEKDAGIKKKKGSQPGHLFQNSPIIEFCKCCIGPNQFLWPFLETKHVGSCCEDWMTSRNPCPAFRIRDHCNLVCSEDLRALVLVIISRIHFSIFISDGVAHFFEGLFLEGL